MVAYSATSIWIGLFTSFSATIPLDDTPRVPGIVLYFKEPELSEIVRILILNRPTQADIQIIINHDLPYVRPDSGNVDITAIISVDQGEDIIFIGGEGEARKEHVYNRMKPLVLTNGYIILALEDEPSKDDIHHNFAWQCKSTNIIDKNPNPS